MQQTKLLTIVALFHLMLCFHPSQVLSQDISWMKGLWKAESGAPYQLPPATCINTLQVTEAADSTFNGLQITRLAADTATNISYTFTGLLTPATTQFKRQALWYKKDSKRDDFHWYECAMQEARTCSLYVEQQRIKLLINTQDSDSACNGTIIYYRDLKEFDSATQQYLLNMYKVQQSYTNVFTTYSTSKRTTHYNGLTPMKENNTAATDTLSNDSTLPPLLRERTNKLAQILPISSPVIDVILLDDAEIDGDIITLYHNNVEVLSHKTLGKEVIKYSFKADKLHTHHEIILVAENLGSIPPNTALMRIRAGDKKYELTTRANMHENAKVVIEYTGKE